ncbi:hypothetical protein CKO35_02535 [Ectothiorhodospira shaposhnikovii]|uniref:DUF2269 family protein n=1 Tax=Ectothiorhodospira shaposhnikovii TaxID=1054 RepID=UPI001905AEA9|nr:DUF2269 family protein [Ectothiorhodospira shaposhnikovii]MBK1672193.1 hypothetical protein [Ectothiorhodospira shaposhnikovii]
MEYILLKLLHLLGAVVMASGLIGVWLADVRSKQVNDVAAFAEAARFIRVFYDGLTVPGALLLLISGSALIALYYGSSFFKHPWLVGMVILFLFEFIEGNTVTRLAFIKINREAKKSLLIGQLTPELIQLRKRNLPNFTHYLDLPLVLVIIMLGVLRPYTWDLFIAGTIISFFIAGTLTFLLPFIFKNGDSKNDKAIFD